MGEHADIHAHEIVLAERNMLRQQVADLKDALARERRKRDMLMPKVNPADYVNGDDW